MPRTRKNASFMTLAAGAISNRVAVLAPAGRRGAVHATVCREALSLTDRNRAMCEPCVVRFWAREDIRSEMKGVHEDDANIYC